MGLVSKSYKAFTLWEAIIVMIITSTIVTLSYGSYREFSNLLRADEKSMVELNEAVFLEREILEMLETCKSVEHLGDVIFFNGIQEGSSLEILDSALVIYGMRGNEEREIWMLDWNAEYLDEQSDFVSSFWFDLRLDEQTYHLSFVKHYSKSFFLGMR